MAHSQFVAWLDRNAEAIQSTKREPRRASERLLRVFNPKNLSIFLFYAIVVLSLVSLATTALSLFSLLLEGAEDNANIDEGVDFLETAARFFIAFGTTFGIQTIAVVLSLFLGNALVRLVSRTASNPSSSWLSNSVKRLGVGLRHSLAVIAVSTLLFPFLSFSILFSYATFHKNLETSDEITRKARTDLPLALSSVAGNINEEIVRQINAASAQFGPKRSSTNPDSADRVTIPVEQLSIEKQLQRQGWQNVRRTLEDHLSLSPIEQRAELTRLQAELASKDVEIANLELVQANEQKNIYVLSAQTKWEHGIVLTIEGPQNDSGVKWFIERGRQVGGRCQASDFNAAVQNGIPSDIIGILETLAARTNNNSALPGFFLPGFTGSLRSDVNDVLGRLRMYQRSQSVTPDAFRAPQNLVPIIGEDGVNTLNAAVQELIEQEETVRTTEGRIGSCGRRPDPNGYFGQLEQKANTSIANMWSAEGQRAEALIERLALENSIVDTSNVLNGEAFAIPEKLSSAIEQGLERLNAFEEGLAITSVDGIAAIFSFSNWIESDALPDVQTRLRTSTTSLSCDTSKTSELTTIQKINTARNDLVLGECLTEAFRACSLLGQVLTELQGAGRIADPQSLSCGAYLPSNETFLEIRDLHFANLSVSLLSNSFRQGATLDEDRTNLEQTVIDLGATQNSSMNAAVRMVYSDQLSALTEKIFELDGTSSVRRSWNRLGLMLAQVSPLEAMSLAISQTFNTIWEGGTNLLASAAEVFVPTSDAATPSAPVLTEQAQTDTTQLPSVVEPTARSNTTTDDGAGGANQGNEELESDGAASGLTYVYEAYAFAIAVTIDVMIVVIAVLVVLLRRTPLLNAQGHHASEIDERHLEEGIRGIQREDPTLFSVIAQHCVRVEEPGYAAEIDLARIPGPTRRARVTRVLSLLGNQVRRDEAGPYRISIPGHAYIQYMASEEQFGAAASAH